MSKLPDINDLEPVNNYPSISDLEEVDPYEQAVQFSKKKNSFSPDDLKAGLAGAYQGLTFNFGDEIADTLIHGTDDLVRSGNPIAKYIGEQLGGQEKIADNPISARDTINTLAKNSPKSYLAGEIGGSLLVPVPVLGQASTGAKIGKMALTGAVQGGLDAYGRNENPNDLAKDVATGTLLGGVVGGSFPAIGAGAKAVKEKIRIPSLGQGTKEIFRDTKNKALSVLFDIPEQNVDDIIRNPDKVRNALTLQEVGERIPESLEVLGKKISELDGTAMSHLDDTKQFGIKNKDLENTINSMQESLMTRTDSGLIPIGIAEEKAIGKLEEVKTKINGYDDIVTEKQLKRFVQSLDNQIDWDRIDNSLPDQKIRDLRYAFDQTLKNNNPAYDEAMKPVSELTDLSHYIKQNFGIKKGQGGVNGLVASDLTLSKLNNTLADRKAFTQDKLKLYGQKTGHDILGETKYAKLADSLDATTTNGSRKVNFGAITGGSIGAGLGSLVGAPTIGAGIGTALGGLVGYSADKYARKVGKQFLLNGNPQSYVSRFNGTPYFNTLNNAMKRGNKSLAVTHYLLSQTDPRFRQLDQDKDN